MRACPFFKNRKVIGVSHLQIGLVKIRRTEQRSHMRVEMGEMHSHFLRALDLRAKFDFDFGRLDMLGRLWEVEWKITIRIEQAGNFVVRSHRSPANRGPLTVKSLVDAEIRVGMGFREVR